MGDSIDLARSAVAVVTMDQRGSRSASDAVDRRRRELNQRYRAALLRAFVRTAGDEMQAVTNRLDWIPDLILDEARRGEWWIGVGLGRQDEPLGRTARESRGEAFMRAREAVEVAKQRPWGFVLRGSDVVARADDALVVTSFVVTSRTDRQHEAAILYEQHGTGAAVATALGLTDQSVSERLRGARLAEEAAGRRVVLHLLRDAARAV